MSNILAITHKELKSYFASPIAYVVIGLYALVFGYYFYAAVRFFDRQSMQMAGLGGGAPSVNINEQLIRPVFQYSMVVFLILLPMITMRTYSEEKRSGTMELLLTSPITDFEIIMGKFLGAMGLYAAMLGVTVLHMALLFWVSQPEWMPIVTSYLGLLLMGGCFMSVGLLISSFTKNQIVAVVATFAVFMMLWMINWIAQFMGPTGQAVLNYMSITGHLEDFMGGVVDTKHLVYYLSFIAFGLFLTARSVDTERWRG
jgi:gliding motility-associated transport system permease protein